MKTITIEQHGVSMTRLFVALCTAGLSLPVLGVRRRTRTVRKVKP